jgi:hypothetical protein
MDLFLPHLATTISELVRLIAEAETFESKRRVDNTLNVVIERTGQQVGDNLTFDWEVPLTCSAGLTFR